MIDHTMLRPETTDTEVKDLVVEGDRLGVASVCIPASRVRFAPKLVPLACVIGFPSGAHRADVKAFEAARALEDGADELDMVIDLGAAHSGQLDRVAAEIELVRATCGSTPLKVILESATFDHVVLRDVAAVACEAGADLLKTSTGFHVAGGADVQAVAILAEVAAKAGRPIGVKASGGIRDYESAVMMIAAGATRIGTSSTRAILAGAPD
jgi:deoxyribose-phosphate aldolase